MFCQVNRTIISKSTIDILITSRKVLSEEQNSYINFVFVSYNGISK